MDKMTICNVKGVSRDKHHLKLLPNFTVPSAFADFLVLNLL